MSAGCPRSVEIKEALQACRDLEAAFDDHSVFGPSREFFQTKVEDIRRLLGHVLNDYAGGRCSH
jgi:hypothetical protein